MQTIQEPQNRIMNIVIFFIVLFILVLMNSLYADQKGCWVKYKLPDVLPATWYRAVGENCLIYVGANDSLIVAYDIHSSAWHIHETSIGLPWNYDAAAGDDAAMVWNDSIVVAYSAITNEFVMLDYEGSLVGSNSGYGCSGYMAYFLTDIYFYVFDAEDAQWYQHQYNKPTEDIDAIYVNINGRKDDVLVELANSYGWVERTLIVFSHHTKNFAEINADNLTHERLDHGFVFWVINDFFGGYSAYTGDYVEIDIGQIFYETGTSPEAELLYPRTTYTFFYRVEKEYPEHTGYIYAYDTRHGSFQVASFDHFILVEGLSTFDSWTGSEIGFQGTRNAGGDESVAYYVYSGQTHSFYYTTSPLFYCGFGRPHCCGGSVFTGYDYHTVMAYDVRDQHMTSATLPPRVEGFQAGISINASRNWTLADVKRVYSDTLFIYIYNGDTNYMTVRKEYSTETSGTGYYAKITAENVCGYILMNKFLLYSPGMDRWVEKTINRDNLIFGNFRDYIYYLDTDNIILFNGLTGEDEISLPFGYDTYWYMENYTYKQDNFFIVYNSNNQYVAYSFFTGTTSSYASEFLSYEYGNKGVVVLGNGGSVNNLWYHLTYNALDDCWIPLTLMEEEGYRSNIMVGGKTALILTINGYLFAFDPVKTPVVIEEKEMSHSRYPERFHLLQNMPNPFNPRTAISYRLLAVSDVELGIYNMLGQKIAVLVSERQSAGSYQVQWDASQFSSGVYYYRIEAGEFQDVKKMVLIK